MEVAAREALLKHSPQKKVVVKFRARKTIRNKVAVVLGGRGGAESFEVGGASAEKTKGIKRKKCNVQKRFFRTWSLTASDKPARESGNFYVCSRSKGPAII